jgi:hypothetical protein
LPPLPIVSRIHPKEGQIQECQAWVFKGNPKAMIFAIDLDSGIVK